MSHGPISSECWCGLPQSAGDYAAVAVTAQLADLMGASVVATFVQDPDLVEMAALPCVRELRSLGGGWQPIEGPAARSASSSLQRPLRGGFSMTRCARPGSRRASPSQEDRSRMWRVASAAADDIVVIIEPRNPAERVTQQFTRLVDAAFGASVRGHGRSKSDSEDHRTDRSRDVGARRSEHPPALAIAAAAKEQVIVLGPAKLNADVSISELARTAGVRIEFGPAMQEPLDLSWLPRHLAHLNERLLVMTRAAVIDRGASMIASLRRVPVLLTGPAGLSSPASGQRP